MNNRIDLSIPLKWPSGRGWKRLARWLLPNPGTLLLVVVLLWVQSAGALSLSRQAAPASPSTATINYQGRLADASGTPLNGTYAMTFALWDAAAGGSVVWGPESHAAVPVSDGLFSVGLGSQTASGIPADVWDGDRYLEVSVGGETLSPRELIRSVPIAGLALTVPDGAIRSRNSAPSVFMVSSPGEVPIDDETEVLSLDVNFPIDGTYLIFVRATTRRSSAGRVICKLKDESGTILPGSTIFTYHEVADSAGSQTHAITLAQDFAAGPHTLTLFAHGDGAPGAVRSSTIIAIPFAQVP